MFCVYSVIVVARYSILNTTVATKYRSEGQGNKKGKKRKEAGG